MTNTTKVPGWKVETTPERIYFERGDWICVANYSDVIKRDNEYKKHGMIDTRAYGFGARGIVADWICNGAPIRRFTKTWDNMVNAIADAVSANWK